MNVLDPGHRYSLSDGTELEFIKRENGELIHDGVTNEDLIEVLINRMEFLNAKLPCIENAAVIGHLNGALHWLSERTKARIQQQVKTTDTPHVSN